MKKNESVHQQHLAECVHNRLAFAASRPLQKAAWDGQMDAGRATAPPQPVDWKAVEWPDGTMYEGLAQGASCHRQGVVHFANSDRYEGEFVNNRMQGYGVYIWKNGTIYRGEWQYGMMHGCGVQLRRGTDGEVLALEGKFFADEFVGPVMSCGTAAAQEAAVEADVAAALARALQTPPGSQRRRTNGSGGREAGRGREQQQQQQQQQQQAQQQQHRAAALSQTAAATVARPVVQGVQLQAAPSSTESAGAKAAGATGVAPPADSAPVVVPAAGRKMDVADDMTASTTWWGPSWGRAPSGTGASSQAARHRDQDDQRNGGVQGQKGGAGQGGIKPAWQFRWP